MSDSPKVRIDKFLWAVRIFKTRSMASEACRKGRVIIGNIQVKPSRTVEEGETVIVKKLPVTYTYKVIRPIENRVAAKIAETCIADLTSDDEKAKLTLVRTTGFGIRPKGFGRPTKKERRTIDRITENNQDN